MPLVKPTIGQINWGSTLNTALDYLDGNTTTLTATVALKAPLASPTFTGTVSGITKAMVGLGNVDNTADTAKPVSTAQQTALDLKANLLSPTFTTPSLGVATATSINGTTIPSSSTLVTTGATSLPTGITSLPNVATVNGTTIPSSKTLVDTTGATFTGTVTTPILSVTSYRKYAVAAVTTPITASTYTVLDTDTFVIFNSASSISVTLPTASSYTGRVLNFKTNSTGVVTSATSNVVPISGSGVGNGFFSGATAGKWATLVSNGTYWVIMAGN
jgi:hypothetical protein